MITGNDQETSGQDVVEITQLQKQNERLKEALIKLRDVTTAQEAELQKTIKSLERENIHLKDIKSKYDESHDENKNLKDQLEFVKQQLDDALDHQEMLEQLTEQNLKLSETVDEQRGVIEDLEAIKQLNEELEENHVEAEKELIAEVEMRDSMLRDQQQAIDSLQESNADYQNTILQFRELVKNLQNDLTKMREKYSETQSTEELSSQTQAMLNLNLQLQSSALKATAKSVEQDLRKLEVQESKLHVDIMSAYLPTQYFEQDCDSVRSLLMVKRLTFKSDLISKYVGENLKSSDVRSRLSTMEITQLFHVCFTSFRGHFY